MNVVEQCRIAPPDAAGELVLPLTFFDIIWLNFLPVRRLLFYDFPCSNSHFINTIIPDVKRSLSQALNHFPPFAGKLSYPSSSSPNLPELQFSSGDSVPVVFAEAGDDLGDLIGNGPRDADKFHHLLPELPPAVQAADASLIPILAVQVTLFRNRGVSVGLTYQHVVGDGSTTVNFIKSWSSICRSGGDADFLANKSLHPLLDRRLSNSPLTEKFWNDFRSTGFRDSQPIHHQGKVRATFVMAEANIQKLKTLVAAAPGPSRHVSTFAIVCGYVWSCLVKSGAAVGEEDGTDYMTFAADFRSRLDPPLPAEYFGNCVGPVFAKSPRSRLIGEGGFVIAARLIGEAVHEKFYGGEEDVLRGAGDWAANLAAVEWSRSIGTAGSPRFDVYDADFGWGRPSKFEFISIDGDGSMSLCRSRDSERDLEIGLSLPKMKMDAFATIFNHGLATLIPSSSTLLCF